MSIPPSVLAQYQSVNAQAQQTAQRPFQTYDQTGSAVASGYNASNSGNFVAPVNAQQQAGIAGTNTAANQAQPYYQAATGLLGATQNATTPVNSAALAQTSANSNGLSAPQIQQYLSPYLNTVLGSESALLNQNNQEQQSGALGNAIQSGAFGSDRTGIAAANLEQQQNLANANIYSGILNQGYQSALGTAQGEQQIGLQGAQQAANIGQTAYGEGANTASALAGLGAGAQSAALQGAQAQIGAGTVEQQTQQAQDAAQYNQFLQQQSYPFQVDQFLANIAEGTGALSGSTTTTTQPGGFFSDKRLKHDIKPIGKTYDGQRLYSYKMHGDDRTHIGLIAQQVEKKHPEAVGLHAGFKTVDYGAATEEAAKRGHFYAGGLARDAYALGGGPAIVDPNDLAALMHAEQTMRAPYGAGAGPYGAGASLPHGGVAHIPAPMGAVSHLVTAPGGLKPLPNLNSQAIADFAKRGISVREHKRTVQPGEEIRPMTGLKTGGRTHFDDGGLADVLSAQQAMYQNKSARQRDIPAQSQSHQLAVANGTPQPPPTGLSNLSQSLQTANNGYNLYNRVNAPSTTNGLSAKVASENQAMPATGLSNAADTTAPAIDYSSTLSAPIDTGAVDAGATDAAASAGADAAGTAIAGGAADAAVGAGVDAAATDAAATLAAEYVAADAIPLILAANRGGVMRTGLATGGMPYSDDGTLDIPDTQSGSPKLQTAGPIKKIPTGLQDLTSLSNPMSVGTNFADMFSNEAAARGGLMRRHGYATDGAVDDDPTVPNPAPVTAPDPETPKPGLLGSVKHWWDANKGYVLPAVSGLAAMGTAPTRHFGVALAQGLGAAAGSYVPTQEGIADSEAQAISNQRNKITLDSYRNMMKGAGTPAKLPDPVGAVSADSTDPAEIAYQRYAPIPTALPQSVVQQQLAYDMAGQHEAAKRVGEVYATQVENATQQRVLGANSAYQAMTKVANADPEKRYATLASVDPKLAAIVAQSAPNTALLNDTALDFAKRHALTAYQYAGRPNDMQNGVMVDKQTGAPVTGSEQLMVGLNPEQKDAALRYWTEPVVVGGGLPQPRYSVTRNSHGGLYRNPLEAVIDSDAMSRVRSAAPGPAASASPSAPVPSAPTQPAPQPAAPPPRVATGRRSSTTGAAPPDDPYLSKALQDHDFDLPPLPAVKDQVSLEGAKKQQDANIGNIAAAKKDNDQIAAATDKAMQNFQAAQFIMNAPGSNLLSGLPGRFASTAANSLLSKLQAFSKRK